MDDFDALQMEKMVAVGNDAGTKNHLWNQWVTPDHAYRTKFGIM
jgi:hypothetical protein